MLPLRRPPIQPRPVYPSPLTHKRYPMAMTIALGILAADSIVMAADTEITAGEMKTEGGKIYWTRDNVSDRNTGMIAVTGAGHVANLEALYCELRDDFLAHPEESVSQVGKRCKKIVREFHRDYIVPYPYPDRPDVSVVIAVRRKGELKLWQCDRSALRPSFSGRQ